MSNQECCCPECGGEIEWVNEKSVCLFCAFCQDEECAIHDFEH